ncbi:hypothetical protein [Sphingomonas sp.]|uniref:hypothetical protein n=1 Tax=Sphingomonas sp. TaxID=28214 RepID=UPI002DD69674|nr:hypothetical protein [Sphingomonas sp.]
MTLALVIAASAMSIAPAAAQDHANHAGHQNHAPSATPVAPAGAVKFTLDTPIETLMADEKARAVVEANVPGIGAHPSYEMFKAMSFNQVAPMSNGQISAQMLAKLQTELAAIK